MDVYWLEQCDADLPEQNDWLSASETARLSTMRFEKRRADRRLGRWTAKRALAACLDLPADSRSLAEMEIRPASSGAPEVFLAGQRAHVTISLSHSAGIAICAVAVSGAELGCDLEVVEPRSDTFVADYFTVEEQELVRLVDPADRPRFVTLLWSGKESALKALGEGLRLDTRCVGVNLAPRLPGKDNHGDVPALALQSSSGSRGWRPLQVRFGDVQVFQGWWQPAQDFVRTLVAAPAPSQPIALLEEGLCHSALTSLR